MGSAIRKLLLNKLGFLVFLFPIVANSIACKGPQEFFWSVPELPRSGPLLILLDGPPSEIGILALESILKKNGFQFLWIRSGENGSSTSHAEMISHYFKEFSADHSGTALIAALNPKRNAASKWQNINDGILTWVKKIPNLFLVPTRISQNKGIFGRGLTQDQLDSVVPSGLIYSHSAGLHRAQIKWLTQQIQRLETTAGQP